MLAIKLDKLAAEGDAGQLLKEKPALAPATETQFADQLLVSGLAPGGGGDTRDEFAIGHRERLEPDIDFRAAKVKARLQATPKVTRKRRGGAQESALCRRMWETADPGELQQQSVWISAA